MRWGTVEGSGRRSASDDNEHHADHTPSMRGEGAKLSVPADGDRFFSHTPPLHFGKARPSTITITLSDPSGGNHRYSEQQILYQCLHEFLSLSTWKAVDNNASKGGMTWIELFILFDVGGWRDRAATFHSDTSSQHRASKRAMSGKAKWIKRGKVKQAPRQVANCTTRASLGTEIANFKAMVRHIILNNADQSHQCLFLLDHRAHIRRLAPFAIIGHQPGINATRTTTEAERRKVEQAIMKQRVGTTPKQALATMRSVHASRDEGEICSIKLKRAKLDTRSVPKWTREFRGTPIMPVKSSTSYTSRQLSCRACGHVKETAHMQLKMPSGYRGIVCPGCHRQARVRMHHCQCKVVWHHCTTHQNDPTVHRSAKLAAGANTNRMKKVMARLSLHRVAPEAAQRRPAKRRRLESTSGTRLHSHGVKRKCTAQSLPPPSATHQPRRAAKLPHLPALRQRADCRCL